MKRLFSAACLLLVGAYGFPLLAQNACEYVLELYDAGGDGWEGATLTIAAGSDPEIYTLESGDFRLLRVPVTNGPAITLNFQGGANDAEVSYALFDAEGNAFYADGPMPTEGEVVFDTVTNCPSCPAPSSRTIEAVDVRAFRADIAWVPPQAGPTYVVEYDTAGFTRGTGTVVPGQDGEARLDGLAEQTDYAYYVYGICGPQDTSTIQGPFSFRTLWATDVGISAILGPTTDCGLLTTDTVTIALANFGGQPQTLIPFRFSVNEVDGGVPIPFDGLYTGVIGKDSVAVIDFETTFNFANPGEYEIVAWTELEGDSDLSNDTTVFRITSIPTITAYPYFTNFETWSSGWTVDTASQFPTWEYGRPSGLVIDEAAGGSRAWVTNLNGPYESDETSYLLSPCLDFSNLTIDPELSFNLFLDLEEEVDSLIVELSLDDGQSWTRVGRSGSGLNWYNSPNGNYWTGTRPWTLVSTTLEGAAGAPEARLRFALLADNSLEREGVGIDNVRIVTPFAVDLAATGASTPGQDTDCGLDADTLSLQISNLGTETVSGFNVAYRVNGGTTVIENTGNLSVAPGEEVNYTFDTPLTTSGFGSFRIEAWVSAANEAFFPNDTTRLTVTPAQSLPFIEDFESGMVPPRWTVDDGIIVTDGHGNLSQVLAFNLSDLNPQLSAETPAFGPVSAQDSFTFDYRYVLRNGDGSLPKELVAGDSLFVQFSTDCGASYTTVYTVDASTHDPTIELSTVSIPFENYDGATVKVRFWATHGTEDYWIDLDHINVRRCPPSLELRPLVQDVSGPGQQDGVASVEPGAGSSPFTYLWETGAQSRTVRDLDPGAYQVLVTDNLGCLDSLVVEVGILSSTTMPSLIRELSLAPNPSRGASRLVARFQEMVTARVQLISSMGQVVWESTPSRTDRIDQMLDLSSLSPGLYLVRIQANEQAHTKKILLAR